MKGFYSVIQYCPDLSRAEAANVGVVIFVEQPRQLVVRISPTLGRVTQFFRPDKERFARISDAASATASRLNHSINDMTTAADLEQFSRTLGNDIRMTPPRVVVVNDIQVDAATLYAELVGDNSELRSRRAIVLPTPINRVFEQLVRTGKVWKPGKIQVPVINRSINIPYAYQNGVVNLVKPVVFGEHANVDGKAAQLAIEGDQFRKHDDMDMVPGRPTQRRLVVISAASSQPQIEQAVKPIFAEYGVVYVPNSEAERFAERVLQEAK